jgi:hypothetical protein
MSTNSGVTPSSYDLIISVSKNLKRFLKRMKMLVNDVWLTSNDRLFQYHDS